MNFHDLRIIVGQIKKNVECPKCSARFNDEDIEIIGSLGDEQVFVHACCNECESEAVINVTLQFGEDDEAFPSEIKRLGTAPRQEQISTNEVLDMHNFLKSFSGDFRGLFKKESKPQ